jgi:head-tail adaptor
MQAGKLNNRITIKKTTRVQDEFGGWQNTADYNLTVWANVKQIAGGISQENGKRSLELQVEIKMRKKTANNVNIGDVITIGSDIAEYRINSKFDSLESFNTDLMATKID